MADNVLIQLKADISDIRKDLKSVQKQLTTTGKSGETAGKKLGKGMDKAGKDADKLSKNIKTLGKSIAAAFSVQAAISFAKSVFNVTAEFQKLNAVLATTLGSQGSANRVFRQIKDFASTTPYQVQEITASFVKLANQGFIPTTRQLRQLGDLAASTGKSFDQLAEAIIDAQVGEFERLKEFGIRAKKSGDQVTFTFKEVETTVKNTESAIRDYITSLGDAEGVTGSMNAISKTLTGQISELGDSWDSLLYTLGNQTDGVFGDVIWYLDTVIKRLEEIVKGANQVRDEWAKGIVDQETFNMLKQIGDEYGKLTNESDKQAKLQQLLLFYNNAIEDSKKIQLEYGREMTEVSSERNKAWPWTDARKEAEKRLEVLREDLKLEYERNNTYEKLISQIEKVIAGEIDMSEVLKEYGIRIKKTEEETDDLESKWEELNTELKKANALLQEQAAIGKVSQDAIDHYAKKLKDLQDAVDLLDFSKLRAELSLEMPTMDIIGADTIELGHEGENVLKEVGTEAGEILSEAMKKTLEKQQLFDVIKENWQQGIASLVTFSNAMLQGHINTENEMRDKEIENVSEYYNKKIEMAGDNANLRLKLEQDLAGKITEINEGADSEIKRIQAQQAQNEKNLALFSAIIDTAKGVAKAFGTYGPTPPGIAAAAFAAAQGAAQIAVISNQPIPKFKRGGSVEDGMLKGPSHEGGGIMIEAEGGEYIVRKGAAQKFHPLLEQINKNPENLGIGQAWMLAAMMGGGQKNIINNSSQFNDRRLTKRVDATNILLHEVNQNIKKLSATSIRYRV